MFENSPAKGTSMDERIALLEPRPNFSGSIMDDARERLIVALDVPSSAAAQKIAIEIWSRNVESMPAPAFPNTGSSILEKIESPSCAWPASDMRSIEFIQKSRQLLPLFCRVS